MIEQQKSSGLTIPCHWDRNVTNRILSQNKSASLKLVEVYGVLADGGPVGHGRSPDSVVKVARREAIDFRNYLRESNLRFTYLLNAPFRFTGESEQRRLLDDYLGWILGELKPDALTISSHELMRFVRSVDSEVPIHISTIAGVQTVQELREYLDVRPGRVVPHHDVGKNWQDLRDLVLFGKQNDIRVELMVTESCLYKCPSRTAHYEHLAHGRKDTPFHLTCNARKMVSPSEFLLAGGVVRPEDVSLFEEVGVDYFKITGRSKPADWLPETVQAYQTRNYEGNLIRLLGIDPSLKAEEWFYVDNKGLNDFMRSFPSGENDTVRREYCEAWAVKLYQEGRLFVRDGSQYSVEGGALKLVGQGGERIAPIVRGEIGC